MTINYKMYADLGKNVTRKYRIQHCISVYRCTPWSVVYSQNRDGVIRIEREHPSKMGIEKLLIQLAQYLSHSTNLAFLECGLWCTLSHFF